MERICVASLIGLGALLTLVGPGLGIKRLTAEYYKLKQDMGKVKAISEDKSLTDDEMTARRHAIRPPTSTYSDIEYFRELIRLYVLEEAPSRLTLPAVLTAAGIVFGAVAAIWSLYLSA